MVVTPHNSSLPRVAVLLAVYNGMKWLEDQVKTIMAQKGVEITLFISVDRSDDGSDKWCQNLADFDSRVVLLPTGQKFGSATQNFFRLLRDVDFSPFQYVSFADQDDIWADHKLLRATEYLESGRYSAYSSNVEAFWPNGKRRLINKSQPQCEMDHLFEAAGPGCTYVMVRDLVRDVQACLRNFPLEVSRVDFHDWFCYAFARGRGYKWYVDDSCFMRYRQHASNSVGVNAGLKPFIVRAKHIWAGNGIKQTELLLNVVYGGGGEEAGFTIPASRLDFLKLAFTASRYRRRLRDRCFFSCFCILKALIGA